MAGNREGSSIDSQMRPDAKVVNEFHSNDDVDKDSNAHHHTLGGGSNQASPGAHRHDGTDSVSLGEGITIAGSKGGNLAVASIIDAMVQMFGVTDNTSP
jgi:hypothetical protein